MPRRLRNAACRTDKLGLRAHREVRHTLWCLTLWSSNRGRFVGCRPTSRRRRHLRSPRKLTTEEPAEYVNDCESEHGAKRNGYLQHKPRSRRVRWKTLHRSLSIRTRRQDIQIESGCRPGRDLPLGRIGRASGSASAVRQRRLAPCRQFPGSAWCGACPLGNSRLQQIKRPRRRPALRGTAGSNPPPSSKVFELLVPRGTGKLMGPRSR